MHIPMATLFTYASRKLVSSFQPLLRLNKDTRPKKNPNQRFSIPHFDAENERLFRLERQTETLSTLKTALLLGATGFLAFVALDIFNGELSKIEILGRVLIVLTLGILFVRLRRHPQPESQINFVAKLSAALSVVDLICILLVGGNPVFYIQTWVGLLPIYFVTYGQMFMTIAETLEFGLLAMLALPLSGYLIGVETVALMPSIIILLIVNAFGFCTRCQLETHARNLFQERRKAECTSEDKTLFLRQLSHNLRQPLQALSCYSSVLDGAFADKPGDPLQPIVGKLGYAIDELNNAFNHILDIANLETGKQIPLLTPLNINVLLALLDDQFTPQAAKRGLKLHVRLRSKPPYSVYSDASILSQIIGNLIDNAIKYTASGWILVETVKVGSNQLKLHVRDTGIGIAEQQKQNIFKEFYRGHHRREDPHVHGVGIGLAYVLKALEHLPEHSLDLYSKPNRGSDFQLRLPIAVEPVYYNWLPNTTYNDVAGSFVFVVDDDREVLDALAEQLSSWGCLVQKASSKAETQAALAENIRPPDLLIIDFYLEDNETAHDIIAAIEADCGPIPTLILSAHSIPTDDKERLPETALLLRKPASAAVLMEMMAKVMGK